MRPQPLGYQVINIGGREFPLFVTPEQQHVAYRSLDDTLTELGPVDYKLQVKPQAAAKKRTERDASKREATKPGIEAIQKHKRKAAAPQPERKRQRQPSATNQKPARTSGGEKASATAGVLSALNKKQRVLHVLALQPASLSTLKAHPLIKRLSNEEVLRIIRSVAEVGQGGKYSLKKKCYREIDPDYSLLESEELEMVKLNVVQKGGLDLSECVPEQEDEPVQKPTKQSSKVPQPSRSDASAAKRQRQAAAALLSGSRSPPLGSPPLKSKMSSESGRQAELEALELQWKTHQPIASMVEAHQITNQYRDRYPEYKQLNDRLEKSEEEFRTLREHFSRSAGKKKKALEKEINELYESQLSQVQTDLHKYNCLHTELQHMKRLLKQWEQKQS